MPAYTNIPDALYKYLPRNFATALVTEGFVQVGTLHYYKNIEHKAIGDRGEGDRTYTTILNQETIIKPGRNDQVPGVFQSMFNIKGGQLTIAKGAELNYVEQSPDSYIFCASRLNSTDLMREFDADTCVGIYDVPAFYNALLEKMVREKLVYDFAQSDDCKYEGRKFDYSVPRDSRWLKETDLSYQKEYRVVFHPVLRDHFDRPAKRLIVQNELETKFIVPAAPRCPLPLLFPVRLQCPELTKFCKIIY
ncbi:MAG: hypothetical protein ACJ77K_13375 [Bacteroidia bacterium]